ncbi:hypothetical protein FSP39_010279 [Pinctada imbricata]|uniref:Uncharacterized protein n=1 Tax=Pinctada imbricata TaxID=66713 RepID=A0AA89BQX8_PINIB|nr:hypothetical protein FSP39_010279 [Pinctada imbricata]
MKSELDLFAVPHTQASIEYGHWVEHRPLSSITDSGPIEFNISGSGDDYLDLNNTFLYLQAKIVTANNNANLDAQSDVGPVNNWLHSLFSQVNISLYMHNQCNFLRCYYRKERAAIRVLTLVTSQCIRSKETCRDGCSNLRTEPAVR